MPINGKEEVYGNYINIDTSKVIQQFNFAEPYIWMMKKDSSEERIFGYEVFDNSCFDGDGNYIFEIVKLDGRDLKLIEVKSGELIEFRNKY